MKHDTYSALAEESDAGWITTKAGDVFMHPLQRKTLIKHGYNSENSCIKVKTTRRRKMRIDSQKSRPRMNG
jgi:hypothetical protein